MYKQILVCSDGSANALHAAEAAAAIAEKFDSKIAVLSVFFPTPLLASFGEAPEAAACMDTVMSIGEGQHDAIQSATGKVFQDHGIPVTQMREFGHPVDTIVSAAEVIEADLIVIGSRGMSGFKSLLLGSVSDGVLHHAHCPILVVR